MPRPSIPWTSAIGALLCAVAIGSSIPVAAAADLLSPPVNGTYYTATSRTTIWADGRFTTDLYAAPHFRQDPDQSWHDISQLVSLGATGLSGETALGHVWFNQQGQPGLRMDAPGGQLSQTSVGLLSAVPTVAGNRVTYSNVASGTDLEYSVLPHGVKEDLILRDATAPHSFSFRIDDPSGVIIAPREESDGSLSLRNDGDWRVWIPAPTLIDADGTAAPDTSTRWSWSMAGDTLSLTVSLDEAWMQNANPEYPLRLDPSVYFSQATNQVAGRGGIFDVDPASPCANYALAMAEAMEVNSTSACAYPGQYSHMRFFLRFDMADLPSDTEVESANLTMYRSPDGGDSYSVQVGIYQAISDRWLADGAVAADVANDYDPEVKGVYYVPGNFTDPSSVLITSLVQDWVHNPSRNLGLLARLWSEDQHLRRQMVSPYASGANAQKIPMLRVTGTTGDATLILTENALVSPHMPCKDNVGGCDESSLDPSDPLFQDRNWSGAQASLVAAPGSSCNTTTCFARQTGRELGTVINFTKITDVSGAPIYQPTHVGVDLQLGSPGQIGRYAPCRNPSDEYSKTCQRGDGTGGYFYSKNNYSDGRNNFSGGIFIDNAPTSSTYQRTCASPCQHYFGQRVQRVDIEVWPRIPSGASNPPRDLARVMSRFASQFPEYTAHRNRRQYADSVGAVPVAAYGNAGVSRLTGVIKRNGLPVHEGEADLRIFEAGASPVYKSTATASSNGGHGLQDLATPGVNGSGYYDAGAMYADYQMVKVRDLVTKRNECFKILIDDLNDFANFDLGAVRFGRDAGYLATCPF